MLACQLDYVSAMAEGKTKSMTEAAKRDDGASHAHLNKVRQAHKPTLLLPLADGLRLRCVLAMCGSSDPDPRMPLALTAVH